MIRPGAIYGELPHTSRLRPDARSVAVATTGWVASLVLFVTVTAGLLSAPFLSTLSVAVGQWLIGLPLLLVLSGYFRLSAVASLLGALVGVQIMLVGVVVLLPSRQVSPSELLLVSFGVTATLTAGYFLLQHGGHKDRLSPRQTWQSAFRLWSAVTVVLAIWGAARVLVNFLHPGRILEGAPIDLDWAISDMPMFEVLSSGIAGFGLGESGIAAGFGFRYHLLSYAYLGGLNEAHGLEPFIAQRSIISGLAAVLLATGVVGWSIRLSRSAAIGVVSGTLVLVADSVALPFLGGIGGLVVRDVSTSATLTAVWLVTVSWGILSLVRSGSWWATVVGFLGAILVTGGKVTSGLVMCGLMVGVVAYYVRDRGRLPLASATAVAVGLGCATAFMLFAYGQATGGLLQIQNWVSLAGQLGTAPSTVLAFFGVWVATFFAFIPRWSGIVGLRKRDDRLYLYSGLGILVVATIIYVIFSPESVDRGWVMVSAAPILGVFAGIGLGRIWIDLQRNLNRKFLLILSLLAMIPIFWLQQVPAVSVRPLIFPLALLSISGIAVATGLLLSRPTGGPRIPVRHFLGALAIPLTLASLVAPVVAPLTSSPPRSTEDVEVTVNEWLSTEWLSGIDVPTEQQGGVLAVFSDQELWAPSLLGLRSYATSSYSGLGSPELVEAVKSRKEEMRLWEMEPSLNIDHMCQQGVTAVWTTNQDLWPTNLPNEQKGSGRLWWLDCS